MHVKKARAAKRDLQRHWSEENQEKYRKAVNAKGNEIRRRKQIHFRIEIAKATKGKDIWKLSKWARTTGTSPTPPPQVPDLHRGDGWATTREEKEDLFFDQFFPPPPAADLRDIDGYVYPQAYPTSLTVSPEDIQRVIKKVGADKAPGPDLIPNRMLKVVGDIIAPTLAAIAQACLETQYHPTLFKTATTVILRKPHKDYTDIKSYRPIALLNTLGKIVETIAADRIRSILEDNNLLPETQMGARKGRSTLTALELLTEQVHTIWGSAKNKVATVLSLDVSGAFDNVSHPRLLHNMRVHRLPESLVGYIHSFLTERSTSVRLNGNDSTIRPVATGIPQGSVLSPILFLVFAAGLLEICNNPAKQVSAVGFVDDVNILTYSNTTEENCTTLTAIHDQCLAWAERHGVKFAPAKYELIHLTRRPKRHNLAATIDIQGNVLAAKANIRILGVQIDSRLRWGQHIAATTGKMASQMCALTRITKSTWGASLTKSRVIYRQVVAPALDYAAPLWFRPTGEPRYGAKADELEVAQNRCLRVVTGAYRATKIQCLQKEAMVAPKDLQLTERLARHVERSRNLPSEQVIERAKTRIRNSLAPKRGPRPHHTPTPKERKKAWCERTRNATEQRGENEEDTPTGIGWVKLHTRQQWGDRWKKCRGKAKHLNPSLLCTNHEGILKIHKDLRRAESSLLTQLRTGVIGLNGFLHRTRVPGVESPECPCGHPWQDAPHILRCPDYDEGREAMFEAGGGRTLIHLTSCINGARALTKWWMGRDINAQFSLAKGMLAEEDERAALEAGSLKERREQVEVDRFEGG